MIDKNQYGIRSSREDLKRNLSLLSILVAILIVNKTFTPYLIEQNNVDHLNSDNWAYAHYRTPDNVIPIPVKPEGIKRVIYISNSHAMSGGRISNHLKEILDKLEPGIFEVYDMSDLGVFAPDILQRVITALNFSPDLIILGVSYLTFTDQMKLDLQALSARSFFKSEVISNLSFGFWVRNYDINVYTDTLVSNKLLIYKYRNFIRNLWETKLNSKLKYFFGHKEILFLDIEQKLDWELPETLGKNLFDWSIYTKGRKHHISDMAEAVNITHENKVPLLAFNIPIHWEKSVYVHNQDDYDLYQNEIREIFKSVTNYTDYQDWFPKEFSTYDALHPTLYGARLHALDICLNLNKENFLNNKHKPEDILNIFNALSPAVNKDYLSNLAIDYLHGQRQKFIGKEIFEANNARNLLQKLISLPIGSKAEIDLLFELSLMIHYWINFDIDIYSGLKTERPVFFAALKNELDKALIRTEYYKKKLLELQKKRLVNYPIPDITNSILIDKIKETGIEKSENTIIEYYVSNEGTIIEKYADFSGKIISLTVRNSPNTIDYRRVDMLGDGSFILIQAVEDDTVIPPWSINNILPFSQFAVTK